MNLSELRTALSERREDYSQSAAKLDRKINQAYLDICSRRRWSWLRREHSFATYAPFVSVPAGPGFTINGAQDGQTEVAVVAIAPTVVPPRTLYGKRIFVESDYYKVVNIGAVATNIVLDRPLRCTNAVHLVNVYYDEVALPNGTLSVSQSVMSRGGSPSSSNPLSMRAMSPIDMSYMDMGVQGQPSNFATVRKEPIPAPLVAPAVTYTVTGTPLSPHIPPGNYQFWFTHIDAQTGAESSPGPSFLVTVVVGADSFDLVAQTARNDFYYRLYRSRIGEPQGGGVPYLLSDPQSQVIAGSFTTQDSYLGRRAPSSASTVFMRLYPTPDAEYEISSIVQMEGQRMGADEDLPLFDAEFHHIILDGAEALMLEANDEQARAGHSRQRFEVGIARMIQMDRLNQQQTVVFGGASTVRGRPSWLYSSGSSEADFKA